MEAMPESSLRRDIVQACRILYAAKVAGNGLGGHLSARLDDERILIKPRPVSWWGLTPEDLIIIDFGGKRIDRPVDERSAVREWPIHAQIYRARPDVGSVLHVHPAASTLMAALGIMVEPLDQDCAGFTDRLPVFDNGAVSISTIERGNEVARALGDDRAVLLKNHGCAVAGTGVADVSVTAFRLEKVAETMLRAASLAKLPLMSPEAKVRVLASRKAAEPGAGREAQNNERWQMLQDYYLGEAVRRSFAP
jgi:ribulose-5-phosphate 4-epimerase/fuculose-1-phosphate aldolase